MAMKVTANIREETYRYAEWLARTTGRSVEDVLSTLADNALSGFKYSPSLKVYRSRYNINDETRGEKLP
jgi:hypothetical protein